MDLDRLSKSILSQLKMDLDRLSNLSDENRVADVKEMLCKLVPSYQSNSKIVDVIYEEKLNLKSDLKSNLIVNKKENKVIRIKTK